MLEGAEPYVQGIADMFFIEDDGIVLVDYKTDKRTMSRNTRTIISYSLIYIKRHWRRNFPCR